MVDRDTSYVALVSCVMLNTHSIFYWSEAVMRLIGLENIRMPSAGTCSSDLLACFLEQHMLYSRPNLPLSLFSGFYPHNICPSSNLCIWGARRLPASSLAQSKDSVLALLLRSDERDIMARRLENMFLAGVSVKMGRSKGRQAPTMPSDDSTMGQYTVGVSRSF